MQETFYTVGKIVNTHGLRGHLKIWPTTDFPEERFSQGSELVIEHEKLDARIPVTVESAKLHKKTYLIKFEQFDDINEVERFKGGLLKVSSKYLSELPPGEYYYHEIIGCEVITEDGEVLGVISEILAPGANDVWVVQREKGKPVLIPYIDEVVKEVDVQNKRVKIHLMEGLI